jgi:hypothetical protein
MHIVNIVDDFECGKKDNWSTMCGEIVKLDGSGENLPERKISSYSGFVGLTFV